MFKAEYTYFVAWITQSKTELGCCVEYGNHLIVSPYKGEALFKHIRNVVDNDRHGAVITSITKLD